MITKVHNLANKLGSKPGDAFKLLREKETISNERIGESPSWIDNLEETLSNLSSAFSSMKTIDKTPVKICKATSVTKNKGATSSNHKEDLKMISVYHNFVEVVKDPICKNEFFNVIPRSVIIENLHAISLRNFVIEELETKDDNT